MRLKIRRHRAYLKWMERNEFIEVKDIPLEKGITINAIKPIAKLPPWKGKKINILI